MSMLSRRVLLRAAAGAPLIAAGARSGSTMPSTAGLKSLTADAKPISADERRAQAGARQAGRLPPRTTAGGDGRGRRGSPGSPPSQTDRAELPQRVPQALLPAPAQTCVIRGCTNGCWRRISVNRSHVIDLPRVRRLSHSRQIHRTL